jgi:hypothetical protein
MENKIKLIQATCKKQNWQCLEDTHKPWGAKYNCLCPNKHKVYLSWDEVETKEKLYCKECEDEKRIKAIHDACIKHNWKCLETKYKGWYKKYKCLCENNHIVYLWNHNKSEKIWICKACKDEAEMREIHKFCEDQNGKCLENKYKGSSSLTLYSCICKNKHIVNLNWRKSKSRGDWCRQCFEDGVKNEMTPSIILIHEYCKSHNGICLENEYKGIGAKNKYLCRCYENHEFMLTWKNKKTKGWCEYCLNQKIDPIKEMKLIHEFCKSKEGFCNENEFKGFDVKYECSCKKNHKFLLNWIHSKYRFSWCKKCYEESRKNKYLCDPVIEFNNFLEFCDNNKLRLLNQEYKGTAHMYELLCENGHKTTMSWGYIKSYKIRKMQNFNCKECHDMEIFKLVNKFCEDNGGVCLDKGYIPDKCKYNCMCAKNHKFALRWVNMRNRGTWCKKCQKNRFENLIREGVETLLGEGFVKIKPTWLRNPRTNRRLELDWFSDKLKLAIECQGPQHYSKVKKFKMTDESLEYQQYKDQIKRDVCKERGITLIEIPYSNSLTKDNVCEYVKIYLKIIFYIQDKG